MAPGWTKVPSPWAWSLPPPPQSALLGWPREAGVFGTLGPSIHCRALPSALFPLATSAGYRAGGGEGAAGQLVVGFPVPHEVDVSSHLDVLMGLWEQQDTNGTSAEEREILLLHSLLHFPNTTTSWSQQVGARPGLQGLPAPCFCALPWEACSAPAWAVEVLTSRPRWVQT